MNKLDKILIVDDEPANVFLLEMMLGDKYELITTDNGKEAMSLAMEHLPDLILLDIMMPHIDGLEVCKTLSKNEVTKDIPVILVSAKIQDKDVEKGLDLGAFDYIKKPISEIDVRARVRAALRIKHREDELKHLNKLKSDFLQIVSHDILSPFTGINTSAYMLLNKDFGNPLNEIQKELAGIIYNSAQKQLRYVKDLLLLALQESDKFLLEIKECELKKLVDDSLALNRLTAKDKDIKLLNKIPESTVIKVDINKVFQILNNLLGNAIKFTPRKGKIEVLYREKDGKHSLSVKDNGTGIKKEKIQQLLGEGKVFSTPGTENEQGTGLGLKICRKIIEAHQGEFLISSEEGKGSTFTFTFPELEITSRESRLFSE